MGADCSFYEKSIKTHARAFLTLNILSIGTVIWHFSQSGQSGFPPNLASNWIFGSFFPLFGSKKISLIGFLYFLVAFKSSKYLFWNNFISSNHLIIKFHAISFLKIFFDLLKFTYSEKATKFCEIFTLLLSYVCQSKVKWRFAKFCGPLRI